MALCPFCKAYIGTKETGKNYKGKKYHPDCFEKMLDDMEGGDDDRTELIKYICKVYNLKNLTPLITGQIEDLTKTQGYTLLGIKQALYYFFELGERSVGENVKGIGIVPFVYDEAREYFDVLSKSKKVNEGFKSESTTVRIKIKQPDYSLPHIDISKIE